MTVSVHIDLGYEFEVKAKYDEVFAVLSDVPRSVSHFPKVDKLTDLGEGVYRWEMQKVGTAQVNIQTVYASKYVCDKARGSVISPSIFSSMPVDFLLSLSFQWPPTRALPTPSTGVHTTVPLPLLLTYLLA